MPTRLGGGRGPETEHVRDQLSAYIDYELSDVERAQVREHLRRCPECENELATLKATKQLLVEMAAQPAPHSFVLTPDMVGRAVSGPIVVRRPGWSLAARLRLASAAFAFLLVFMLSVEVLFQGNAPQTMSSGSALNPLLPSAAESQLTDTQSSQAYRSAIMPTATTAAAAGVMAEATATTGSAAQDTFIEPAPPAAPMPTAVTANAAAAATPPPQPTLTFGLNGDPKLPSGAGGAWSDLNLTPGQIDGTAHYMTGSDQGAPQAPAPVGPALDPWRLAEVTVLVLALALALGSLWAARRQA